MKNQLHYLLVNGYSTNYWGWGGEDDDMFKRIINKQLTLDRPPASLARYKMLKHVHQKLNPNTDDKKYDIVYNNRCGYLTITCFEKKSSENR
ncbi:unnamed protein product [Adineta steineri]|uniref:Galactosyltransferase C-terminal domain-containing protein n=1 Tax=Adineta steineri TaxID=433720 RepID=A0A814GBU4_9BILA|nr:unnamed protein product [Adineta steineri]